MDLGVFYLQLYKANVQHDSNDSGVDTAYSSDMDSVTSHNYFYRHNGQRRLYSSQVYFKNIN
jgi:hypothetical protein